jgi:hypothetical protein
MDGEGRKKAAAFTVDVKTGEMEEVERRGGAGGGSGDASPAALQREERERNKKEADEKRQVRHGTVLYGVPHDVDCENVRIMWMMKADVA